MELAWANSIAESIMEFSALPQFAPVPHARCAGIANLNQHLAVMTGRLGHWDLLLCFP
jgi:hypothetical protein